VRLVIFRSLVVLSVGALFLVGVLYVASTVDARAPAVVTFSLTQSLPDEPDTALITTSIEVVFNEPVQVDAGTAPITIQPAVEGTVSWSGSTMFFTPGGPLELETEYVATIGEGIRDRSGNRIAEPPPSFAFRTAGRPSVAETDPSDGARDVAVDEPLLITFSTLMDTGSVERALEVEPAVEYALRWSGEVLEIDPAGSLEPGRDYRVEIGGEAADVAGVAVGEPSVVRFRTVAAGLEPIAFLPSDGVDGIAPTAPIAIMFDRAIDADSVVDDLVTIGPSVAGTLEVVSPEGDPVDDEDAERGTVLRFTPSGALPLNTTFDVTIAAGLRALDGGRMAEDASWSFTTGAPASTLSNRITFISDRSGVPNVWAMNADGSGQHQVSTELIAVVDYAVSPDGSRIVIADGRRLVAMRADGSDRRVLTDDGVLEFDPAFAPDGQRLAFGRADADTGDGLGLWLGNAEGGDATSVELPAEIGADPTPTPGEEGAGLLRAPRFSPDGQAVAFVDATGSVAILELPAERVTRVDAIAEAPPAWLPDSSAVLVTHRTSGPPGELVGDDGRVLPLGGRPWEAVEVGLMNRSGTTLAETEIGAGASVLAVDRVGRVAYLDRDGHLMLADAPDERGDPVEGVEDVTVASAAFATGEDAMAIVVVPLDDPDGTSGTLEHLDLESGERTLLAPNGARPRWLP
jgi:Bacterial Ig-like domain/WD40-like Beta Propeller Repeat